ncbi:MAG: ABC transporter permease subunit, partial [Anaerolineales bacterium]|nr:ABC transporter permease subunit [Anaerolineales bacterium]
MAIQTPPTDAPLTLEVAQEHATLSNRVLQVVSDAVQVLLGIELAVIVFIILGRLIKSAPSLLGSSTIVDETLTRSIAKFLIYIAPFAAYGVCSRTARSQDDLHPRRRIVIALAAAAVLYIIVTMGQVVFEVGPYTEQPSFGFSLSKVENGARIDSLVDGGAASEAGLQESDVILGIRRADLTYGEIKDALSEAGFDDVVRLRILRDEEEQQIPVTPGPAVEITLNGIITRLGIALLFTIAAFYWRGQLTSYVLLILSLLPLLLGYFWLFISTLSRRTEGLTPVNTNGDFGGFTFDHWEFIADSENNILSVTFNTFVIAATMVVLVLLVSSMAGYALSRMKFAGRRSFLSLTLILHGFPAVTLLLAIFFVLQNISKIPVLGDIFGFNTQGGIALVLVSFELPLGVWLMKGFFDGIPWDMERSALIDGASRWRTFWEILLPQIRPGLLALGIFS